MRIVMDAEVIGMEEEPLQLGVSSQTDTGYMTFLATYGNGQTIGMGKIIIQKVLKTTQLVRMEKVKKRSSEEAHGTPFQIVLEQGIGTLIIHR